ncbi:hypothetical protein TNCV_4449891 [Trichonephila clavipes]|nr:hypothetical protein TNCV_4449891 [Trichonephila clavipes]
MTSVFYGHEINRAYLGHSRQMSYWPPNTPTSPLRTGKGSSGGVEQNTQHLINRLTDSMPQRKWTARQRHEDMLQPVTRIEDEDKESKEQL